MSAPRVSADSLAAGAAAPRPNPGRRGLTYAVLLCLAGAGLVLFAASRTWTVEVTVRPAPLPSIEQTRTGGDVLSWLPPLALVGMAGAGAVLATRGGLRRLLGGLLTAVGVALMVAGGYGLAGPAGQVSRQWPLLCLLGGVLVCAGGIWTALAGHLWPAMGVRYERQVAKNSSLRPTQSVAGSRTTDVWDALDRGEDPTLS